VAGISQFSQAGMLDGTPDMGSIMGNMYSHSEGGQDRFLWQILVRLADLDGGQIFNKCINDFNLICKSPLFDEYVKDLMKNIFDKYVTAVTVTPTFTQYMHLFHLNHHVNNITSIVDSINTECLNKVKSTVLDIKK
jgi:hypothetical protein